MLTAVLRKKFALDLPV